MSRSFRSLLGTAALFGILLSILSWPLPSLAEQTFTAVCDLTDNSDESLRSKFTFDERMFTHSSYEYDHGLALASLGMAVSGFSAHSNDGYSRDAYVGREANIRSAYMDLGFLGARFMDYSTTLNDSSSKAAFAIAYKNITANGETYTLVSIVVRGGGYGAEWADDFLVGSDDDNFRYHLGFYTAAQRISIQAADYIRELNPRKVKVWITGYSRGAAIANLIASNFTQTAASNVWRAEDVYTYAFATPRYVVAKSSRHPYGEDIDNPLFKNIYNIINPEDAVPNVPLKKWGFERYGVTRVFPDDEKIIPKVSQRYKTLTGGDVYIPFSHLQQDGIANLTWLLNRLVDTRNDYAKNAWQTVVTAYMQLVYTKDPVYPDQSISDKFRAKYGVAVPIVAVSNIPIISDINILTGICQQSNVSATAFINSILSIDKMLLHPAHFGIGVYTYWELSGTFSGVGQAHYPEAYLSWMLSLGQNWTLDDVWADAYIHSDITQTTPDIPDDTAKSPSASTSWDGAGVVSARDFQPVRFNIGGQSIVILQVNLADAWLKGKLNAALVNNTHTDDDGAYAYSVYQAYALTDIGAYLEYVNYITYEWGDGEYPLTTVIYIDKRTGGVHSYGELFSRADYGNAIKDAIVGVLYNQAQRYGYNYWGVVDIDKNTNQKSVSLTEMYRTPFQDMLTDERYMYMWFDAYNVRGAEGNQIVDPVSFKIPWSGLSAVLDGSSDLVQALQGHAVNRVWQYVGEYQAGPEYLMEQALELPTADLGNGINLTVDESVWIH
ncbi:hypothetical protein AGMMS49992_30810 [Clostridia bacterium]|nr:hypothetical protein AGMMS49992_30810 [Clostridia bacterium]